jgi:hypothetical protein
VSRWWHVLQLQLQVQIIRSARLREESDTVPLLLLPSLRRVTTRVTRSHVCRSSSLLLSQGVVPLLLLDEVGLHPRRLQRRRHCRSVRRRRDTLRRRLR